MPFCTDPWEPHVPPDFTSGLADVRDWPARKGEALWILDPKEHPKPVRPGEDPAGLGVGDPGDANSTQKRKNRKKHHLRGRQELKVTNCGEGPDSPIWSRGPGPGSSSESSFCADSSIESAQNLKGVDATGAKELDTRDLDNTPLSDHPDYRSSDDEADLTIVGDLPGTVPKEINPAETRMQPRNPRSRPRSCNAINFRSTVGSVTSSNQFLPLVVHDK